MKLQSLHIGAIQGEIADTVLLPGDPLRAKFIAENYLKNVYCYNKVRNMLGYTGVSKETGKKVSVQGTGMGMPSLSIYVNELIDFYGVKNLIRVGTAGSLTEELPLRSIVLAQASCSDSGMNLNRFPIGITYAPIADWKMLFTAHEVAKSNKIKVKVGNIFSTDTFYGPDHWKTLAKYGVLAVEMETAELYTLAAQKKVHALSILTVSDNLVTGEKLSAEDRQSSLREMMTIALSL
ncbi:MAG: purine-nucleoside phosphorylase [Candidatus Nomurabacteria bacterium]|nr:purine-nucleoside phosphorylase [Candidatus Nomurabacteria bacterium]